METTQTTEPAKLYAALAKAQGEFLPIAKNRTVKITSQKDASKGYVFSYADLETVIAATRPALAKHGLSIIQPIIGDKMITMLCHESGESIRSEMSLPHPFAADPKQYGATVTYFRRYAYQSLVCVSADDDLDENGQEPQGSDNRQQHAPSKTEGQARNEGQPKEKPPYTDEQFKANFPLWETAIKSGNRSPEQVVSMVESKFKLTEQQKQKILGVKHEDH